MAEVIKWLDLSRLASPLFGWRLGMQSLYLQWVLYAKMEIVLFRVVGLGMAIRAWPAGSARRPVEKKYGVGQGNEPAGPRGPGPHRPAARVG